MLLSHIRQRKGILIILVILIPIGLLTKIYTGPGMSWVNYSLGGVIYVIFWSLFVSLFYRKPQVWQPALWVLLVTCILETLQLWHPQWLEAVRKTFPGRAMLGTSFSWLDFVHYGFGFIISVVLLYGFREKSDQVLL